MQQTTVNLKDQQTSVETYQWHLDDNYFAAVQGPEIQQGDVDVTLEVHRLATATYDLLFRYSGVLTLPCDRCLEPMQQPIAGESTLRVKMGGDFCDDGDQITIPEQEGTVDVAWNLYEMLALQIPLRHVHPDGECGTDLFQEDDEAADAETTTDPRWDALKALAR